MQHCQTLRLKIHPCIFNKNPAEAFQEIIPFLKKPIRLFAIKRKMFGGNILLPRPHECKVGVKVKGCEKTHRRAYEPANCRNSLKCEA